MVELCSLVPVWPVESVILLATAGQSVPGVLLQSGIERSCETLRRKRVPCGLAGGSCHITALMNSAATCGTMALPRAEQTATSEGSP